MSAGNVVRKSSTPGADGHALQALCRKRKVFMDARRANVLEALGFQTPRYR